MEKHDFYKHIFPQITKFFAFFKNSKSRNNLIEKLFTFIRSSSKLKTEFKEYLGRREVYKALKDTIKNSQNILLIINDTKPELQEVFETYTDTWDKMVRVEILKQYTCNEKTIFTMYPDFEDIEFVEAQTKEIEEKLQLGKRESNLLRSGSIDPDKWMNFPHHFGKDGNIANNILVARAFFLKEDDECYHKLGIALHYIADRWTLRPRTKDKHIKYEVAIEASSIITDSQLKRAIVDSLLFPTKVEDISTSPHLTEESKRVIAEKTIKVLDLFFDRIDQKERVISFVKVHLDSPRKKLRRTAETFLEKWS